MRVAFALKEITKSTPDAGLALAIVANVVATPPEVWMMLLPESVMLFDPARTLNWTFVLVPLALSVTCTRKPRLPPGRSVVLRPPKPITLSSYPIEARDSTISPQDSFENLFDKSHFSGVGQGAKETRLLQESAAEVSLTL